MSGKSIIKDYTFLILNALNNHWVLLTNIQNKKNTCTIHDLLGQPRYLSSLVYFFTNLSHIIESEYLMIDAISDRQHI